MFAAHRCSSSSFERGYISPRSECRRRSDVAARAAVQAQPLALKASACCLPHPEKVATGGEDAYFISEDARVLGVADGVGGWRESGIDPGDYSRTLMRVACDYFNSGMAEENTDKGLEETVRSSIAQAHKKTRMPGSSTVCIMALDPEQNAVSAANLGDSGFAVIRNGSVVFQTPPLLHYFDCPYQLGAYPEFVEATNYPSDAETYTVNVMVGDTIVMGTDGLWDNCTLKEVAQLIPDTDDGVESSAEVLAATAREHADDPEYDSPYTQAAREEGIDLPWWEKVVNGKFEDGKFEFKQLVGGKLDDITVVVARVTEYVPPPPEEECIDSSEAPEESSSETNASQETAPKGPSDTVPEGSSENTSSK